MANHHGPARPLGTSKGWEAFDGHSLSVRLRSRRLDDDGQSVIFVTGEVGKPGSYRWRPGTTVAELIFMAGGGTERMSLARSEIRRPETDPTSGEKTIVVIRKLANETLLQPNDILVAARKWMVP